MLSQTIAGVTRNYSYDVMNRLSSTTQGEGYSYDRYGNRAVATRNAPLPALSAETPNGVEAYNTATNRIGAFSYDPRGNVTNMLTRSATYDGENHQLTITPPGPGQPTHTYAYDGEGRRVKKTVSGSTTVFVYDAMGQLAAEYGGTSTETGTRYVAVDHLGSTRRVMDSAGSPTKTYDYLPFGEEVGVACQSVDGGPKFTGHLRDCETGLDFFGARYLSSAQGRFTSPDVPFADQHPEDPQSWSLYSYVRNNPLKYVDPTGNCSAPALEEGQVGTCMDLYIQKATLPAFVPLGVAFGDGRGPAPNDSKATYRQEVQIVITPGGQPSKVKDDGGVSIATPFGFTVAGKGTSETSVSKATFDSNGDQHFSVSSTGLNGLADPRNPFAPSDTIKTSVNFIVTSDGRVGLDPGGMRTAYPSIEIYRYTTQGNVAPIYTRTESGRLSDLKRQNQPIPAVRPR